MELRPLSRTGVRVSALCLGSMTFGREADEATSAAIVDRFLDAGGNFVDTADVYGRGASEEIVGRAIKGRRDNIVLATKGRLAMGDDPNQQGASRRHLIAALDGSLRRLQTDWIDLYQIHWPDPTVTPEETLSTLDSFVKAGKIRYIGVSNYLGSHLQRAIDLCERNNWEPIISHQPQYSLVCREIEQESLPLCAQNHIAVIPWSPLGGGVLTGKYRAGETPPEDTRFGASEVQARRALSEQRLAIVDAVGRVAETLGKSRAQVALNWVLHRPGITAPILGARTVAQLDDNLGAAGWRLTAEQVEALNKASRLSLPYPHDMYRMLGLQTYD